MALDIRTILTLAVELKASDVHLTVGVPPFFRVNGELLPLGKTGKGTITAYQPGTDFAGEEVAEPLSGDDVERLIQELMDKKSLGRFLVDGECDFAFSLPGAGRFRVNCFRQRGSPAAAIRLINTAIPSLRELGLPPVVKKLARLLDGLILVTGPTGSGKSTTLAAMIDFINNERSCHIITLEDPIEYLHRHKRSIVNQREIGNDSKTFASALRAALREDPDVIFVGEMRDLETTRIALNAADTGQLVLATMHTPNATLTVNRIIDMFPPHQQGQIRVQLAGVLQGVIAQQLIPRADGKGRALAVEVLVANPAVRNLIREGKTHQMPSVLQTGSRHGMISFEKSIRRLYSSGLISRAEMQLRVGEAELAQT
ncbi:MAG: type IV pilus twitching motility protein PilT [Bacillota bacterium]